jgi:hypothetical protein
VLAIFLKIHIFLLFPFAKPKNFVVFTFTYVSRSPALFNGDFYMNFYSIDSDEAFNGSSHQFLRSVKCFIASIFHSALNASSPLILMKNRRLTLYRRYFFKQIHHLALHHR